MTEYTIGEFSGLTGLSIHTLRYYEKEGLITPIRNTANRRCYTDQDLTWIDFIKRLKATRMPIKDIRKYAHLRAVGESTFAERMELLIRHHTALLEEITIMQDHLNKLENKIDYYAANLKTK